MSIRFGALRRLLDWTTIAKYGRAALVGVVALALCGASSATAANLIWNSTVGNWVDPNVFSYNNSGAEATASNPFTFVGSDSLAGANTVYIGNNGDVTINSVDSTYGAGFENLIYGVRVGTTAAAANVPGTNDYRGSGILRVTGNTPLTVHYQTNSGATGVDGTFTVGQTTATGEVFWDSTDTLNVGAGVRIGQFGAGTFTQNNGAVIGGSSATATNAFFSIGNNNGANAGNGTYHLNNGELRTGAAQDANTGVEVRRQLRVGLGTNSVGVLNVGDGVGAAGSAKVVTWDDFKLGEDGTGTVNIKSDGRIEIHHAALFGDVSPVLVEHGAINQQGGSFDVDGLLSFGHVNDASYNITGSTGSINARALTIGNAGTLGYTFDAAGATRIIVEGDTNTAGDTVKGITLGGTSTLSLNSFSSYASNSNLTLIESLDSSVFASGLFGNLTQGQSVGTNSLGTTFHLNYFGGTDGNDVVLQTTVPGSLTTGLVWNAASADFTSGFAQGNGNYGVGTFPADPFAVPAEELFLGNNGVAALSTSGSAASLQVGTDDAQTRIAGRNGNGTLNATGSASLTLNSTGATGDLIVGEGGFTGTVNWGSTGALEAQGKLWIGNEGTGVVTQTDGVVSGGTTAAGSFLAIGLGAGGDGTYNLNNGQFRPTGTLDNAQVRVTAVGDAGGVGELNVGDGTGAAGSALLEANNDLWIGRDGGTGVLNVMSDGRINLDSSIAGGNAELHVGDESVGTVIQTGGSVSSVALVRIGAGVGGVGAYTISGGTLAGATDGSGAFQIGRAGGAGTLRIEGTGAVTHGAEFFVGNETNTGGTGRLELVGSTGSLTIGQLENAPGGANGVNEFISWEADANGVIPIVITGAGPAAFEVQLQDPNEVTANTGAGATLMGDGIALELDLSAITTSTTLTLIDNQSSQAVNGFFENPALELDLYEEGALITGTGFAGTVNISYIGGTGDDVVLNLVAGATEDADFDGDGDVDGSDFLTWQRGVGISSGANLNQGDANADGAVNAADLGIWKGQFGPAAEIATAAVPEPCTIALSIAAASLVVTAARRRRTCG